jgi:hypothetical protein
MELTLAMDVGDNAYIFCFLLLLQNNAALDGKNKSDISLS